MALCECCVLLRTQFLAFYWTDESQALRQPASRLTDAISPYFTAGALTANAYFLNLPQATFASILRNASRYPSRDLSRRIGDFSHFSVGLRPRTIVRISSRKFVNPKNRRHKYQHLPKTT